MTDRTILAVGDSNTYGVPPMRSLDENTRLSAAERWVGVMSDVLGEGTEVIAEGLPGRTAGATPDPELGPATNGQLGLRMALLSHGPIDDLVIMLGTNDQKAHFGRTAEAIAGELAACLTIAVSPEMQTRHGGFQTWLICPPAVQEIGFFASYFYGAAAKSAALPGLLAPLAAVYGARFINANDHIATDAQEGVHFDAATHAVLGRAIAQALA